jgi:steroid delta-isomerase-like uncharacterized protein
MSTLVEAAFRSYIEAFNRADVPALVALYAERTEFRNPFSPAPLTSRAAVHAFVAPMFAAYSDMRAEPEGVLVAGDGLAARVTIEARHTGELREPAGAGRPAGVVVRPAGKTVRLRTAEFLRVDTEGLIAEHERIFDSAAVLLQLGIGGSGESAGSGGPGRWGASGERGEALGHGGAGEAGGPGERSRPSG